MNMARLARRAKETIDRRGGPDALKRDAEELRRIAQGKGTAGEKAKRAADALKQPGAPGKKPRAPSEPRGPYR